MIAWMRVALSVSSAALLVGTVPWQTCRAAPVEIKEKVTGSHAPWKESKALTKTLARTHEFPKIDDPKMDLEAVLTRFQEKYGLTFEVNERAFKDAKIEDVLKTKVAEKVAIPSMKTTLSAALMRVLSRVPASSPAIFVVRSDTIELTTAAAWLRELDLPANTDHTSLVKKQFRKVELRQALEEIGGTSVLIDIRVESKALNRVTANFNHVPVATALELLADTAGLAIVHRGDIAYVTSPANAGRMKKDLAARALLRSSHDRLPFFRTGLRTPKAWQPNITFHRALEATGEDHGVNVLIDPRVEKRLRGRVTVRLSLPSTETLLDLLADMAGLAVVKKSNVYYVTSPDNAAQIRKENVKPPIMEYAE